MTGAQGHDFRFYMTIQHVIAGLLDNRKITTVRTSLADSFLNLGRLKNRCSPVQDFPLVDKVIHCPYRLGDFGLVIETMAEI